MAGLFSALISCDTIEDGNRLIDQGIVEVKSERCVLLEDYTGVRCVNCPNAAEIAKNLQAAYGKKLVVIGMYPKGGDGLTLPYPGSPDLRTDEATTYASFYKIEAYPKGMVNRKSVLEKEEWTGAVSDVFNDSVNDYVNLEVSAQLTGTKIQVNINGNFKKTYPQSGNIHVIAMVLEDNITAAQLKGSAVVKDYIHNHVLRAVISDDVWGDKVLDEMPMQDKSFAKTYTYEIKAGDWKTGDLSVVAVVVNAQTKEVLQAAYTHVAQ